MKQQRPSCLSSSNENQEIQEKVKPWVGIASTDRFDSGVTERDGATVKVQIQTTDDGSDRSWLHLAIEKEISNGDGVDSDNDADGAMTMDSLSCFDLSSPREWLEYNEMKDRGITGAYTVLRCDLHSNSISSSSVNDIDKKNKIKE